MAPSDERVDFPPPVELEKWMMSTAKETDRGAGFLRRMLNMNPAYGQQLAEDEDLSEIVQVFAKRFRGVVNGAEIPLQPATLYKPLCEVIWRVIGHVLSSLVELSDGQNSDVPVPKQALGQVKMLLQSNLDLSNKLKEARRTYLIELTEHRDKQRFLSEQVQRAVASLREQPVMFYEPLEYVLDETTKDFVRLVVEERVKLEMRAGYKNDEAHAEMAGYMHDLEVKIVKKEAELKQLRLTAAKAEQDRRKALEALARAEQEAKEAKEVAQQAEEEFEQMAGRVSNMEHEVAQKQRRIALLERESPAPDAKTKSGMQTLNEQLETTENQMKALQEQVMKLQMENKKQKKSMAAITAKAVAAGVDLSELVDELDEATSAALFSPEAKAKAATAAAAKAAAAAAAASEAAKTEGEEVAESGAKSGKGKVEKDKEGKETIIEKEGKDTVKVVEKVVEKIVHVTDTAAQEGLVARHMQVERELRDALAALQKQLEEEQAHSRRLSVGVSGSPEEEAKRRRKGKRGRGGRGRGGGGVEEEDEEEEEEVEKKDKAALPDDRDIEKAIKKVSSQFEKQVKELEAEIVRLEGELEAARAEGDTVADQVEIKPKKKKKTIVEEPEELPQEKGGKWKRKYEELEVQYDELTDEHTKLEQKVTGLLDKLREKMSDDEVQETLTRIKLSPPPPKKKRKRKAYERLYDDAQRRVVDMKVKQEKAQKAELQVLADAAQKVKDRRSLRAVEALVHLQKAASSTSMRFHEAVSKFQEQHPDDPAAEPVPDMAGMTMNTSIPEEASPEWVAAMAHQHYHRQTHRASQIQAMWNRGRTVSRSLSTPPGRVSSTSPGLDIDAAVNPPQEMPFPPASGSVNQLMSPHYSIPAPGQPTRTTSPSTASMSPGMRRRTYGTQAMPSRPVGARPSQIQIGPRSSNPSMPRASLMAQSSPSWHSAGRQSVAQAASMQSGRKVSGVAEEGKMETWFAHQRAAEAAGSLAQDPTGPQSIAGRHPSIAAVETGGLRASDELLMQATPPGLAPTLSPSPPGFSTRLGNESGRKSVMHAALDPMSRTAGPMSPGPRRNDDIFVEKLQGQKLSKSWGGGVTRAPELAGRFERSTPDLTVMASSYPQDDLRSPGWDRMQRGKTKQKKAGVAMLGATGLSHPP